ncbi:MAG: MATE family efflux transporter [Deltaproteobacteria bacterium]|nr:MATE family efflux transporter [Deltaproteobacteria bacterium]
MDLPAPTGDGVHVDMRGGPYRTILRLATPTMIAMLSQSIVNEIDIVFFAQLPCPESSNGQAALAPSLIALWAFGGSLSAISVGTQALTARRAAEGNREDAGAVLMNAATFALVAGAIFTIIGFLILDPLMHALVKNPDAADYAVSYTRFRFLGIVSMAMTFAFKAFFDGLGQTRIHMVSALVMNAVNIGLCWLLIFGNAGAPRMGPPGAGLAALLSTWVGLAIMIAYGAKRDYRRVYQWFDRKKLSWSITWQILRLAIPGGIATMAVMVGFGFFLFVVGKLDALTGKAAVTAGACGATEAVNGAATTAIIGILKLTFTACLAFGTATATLVGTSLGEKDPQKAAMFGWSSVKLGLLLFGILGVAEGILFTKPILAFVSHSPAVQEAALLPFRMMGLATPVIAVAMILTQALFGAGNSRFVMIVELILHFTCLMPLAWLFGVTFGGGLPGIWASAVIYAVALAAAMVWKFARGDWKTTRI